MSPSELCFLPAYELARRVRQRELSALELMQAHLARIAQLNPTVNAIVTLVAEQAIAGAQAADAALARNEAVGPLHGLPVAHKDLFPTRGIRTTWGSPIYREHLPDHDAIIVERLRAAGAITIGKTNTPEFGAGSQTFNPVFGATLNPYDLSKTCGGSSGGAAVALACGMVALADGSDMGGSLRNPASFCNIVGLRPAPGRVPIWPSEAPWSTLSVHGPMARTVQDVALMLSAIAGPDSRSPISIDVPGACFRQPLERDFTGVRLAWSPDLGGLPVDPQVAMVIATARPVFAALGLSIEEATPDFSGADAVFRTWRAWLFALSYGELLATRREQLKETIIWNTEEGLALTGADLAQATRQQAALYHRMRAFMQTYEFLACPVVQVPPFDVRLPYVSSINGVSLPTYIDWMRSCYSISATGHPAISVPCGFTPEGLPIGIQLVGRHRDELGLLQLAHAFEQATGYWRQHPQLPLANEQ